MKQSKANCSKPTQPPKPNLKNKNFAKWSRAELCKKDDNIVSTDWHETLKTTNPFVPAYDNDPICMNYLLSGEYGRIWQKERDDWYKNVFMLKGREKDMEERRKKIWKEAKAAKKKAEKEAKERRERKAKEAEVKAKAEAEKAEKIKAKMQKCVAAKKAESHKKKKKDKKEEPSETEELKKEICPKNWVPVELTVQCECSDHTKETENPEQKKESELDLNQSTVDHETNDNAEQNCVMCGDYMQQLKTLEKANAENETRHCNQLLNSEKENSTPVP